LNRPVTVLDPAIALTEMARNTRIDGKAFPFILIPFYCFEAAEKD
jgi:hypothetical protein